MNEKISTRINKLIGERTKGNVSAFAREADIQPATMHLYAANQRKLPAEAAVKIAMAAGVSTDWLLTGKEAKKDSAVNEQRLNHGPQKIDEDALATCIKMLERHLTRHRKKLNPAAKAKLIVLLYDELLEQEEKEIKEEKLKKFVELAAA